MFAAMLTILLSAPLISLFNFDTLSADIAGYIAGAKSIIMAIGIIFAYVDAFLYRSGRLY